MFDQAKAPPRKKIAIVGAGVSGLSAAYSLAPHHDVTLYEAEPRLGGHARTVLAGKNGTQPVDTGFIVFNYATYPHLTRLFAELDVPVAKSEMSFGVSIDDGRLEFGMSSLRALFAQKRNLVNPQFLSMIGDILRFGKKAEAHARDDDQTVGDLVRELGLGAWFHEHYLLPMCSAIWSTPRADVAHYPARSLVRFFRNHALLAGSGKHQWWTVDGGSMEYVRRIEAALIRHGATIRTGAPVAHVARHAEGVRVQGPQGDAAFDEVIFACHSDQALAILGPGATAVEAQALGAIRYQPNQAVLHCDAAQMPKRQACWASWVYRAKGEATSVTYWMNRLQNIDASDPLFISLNPLEDIPEDKIYDQVSFAHPVFDSAAMRAQASLAAVQGQNHSWFVGAYHRYGFHEDGIASALPVVAALNGAALPVAEHSALA